MSPTKEALAQGTDLVAPPQGISKDQEKNLTTIQIDSLKTVTEKMVKNLLTKTNSIPPRETRIFPDSGRGGTQIFLIYEDEYAAKDTETKLDGQILNKCRFDKKILSLADLPKTGEKDGDGEESLEEEESEESDSDDSQPIRKKSRSEVKFSPNRKKSKKNKKKRKRSETSESDGH